MMDGYTLEEADWRDKAISLAESLDWKAEVKNGEWFFEKYSPEDQDVCVSVIAETEDELIHELYSYWDSYDPEEETYLWLDHTGHGANGAPYSMRELLKDMDWVNSELEKLWKTMEKIKVSGKE